MNLVAACAFCAILLGGCSTNPVTGRGQIVDLPAVQAHADLGYVISSRAQRLYASDACDYDCRARENQFLGSGALMVTWADEQRREADEIAIALLVRTGRSVMGIAKSLAQAIEPGRLPESEWAVRLRESAVRVASIARTAPQFADFDNWLMHQSVQSIERVEACLRAKGGAATEAELLKRRLECMGNSS